MERLKADMTQLDNLNIAARTARKSDRIYQRALSET